ncbi:MULTISPECIES: hypothetical protein [Thermomonospora]|uniref:DUF7919 domain-containing protein n=1 Tax=Thermomonospora curvata (strain ATCC 19995 / DSM 43183 / JCM 3096 / KCTC 9072 / NBRC 15933 / NCIMB 10081 / Henssen B9) TaxID=471852 RepID=D1ADN7_THECD|nr:MULTISPECIES: hypothetical protein [Thermomonospora]ACY97497.1 conserved hypothetical protein [Thermomonospora curvata DSM 43183]PKK14838.1 MAG: hypothetical protein BUE48_009475 [Thermomonospora sp. CIF 1]
MPYFPDLSPYANRPSRPGDRPFARRVGWLGARQEFPVGRVPAQAVRSVLAMVGRRQVVNVVRSQARCPLCPPGGSHPVVMPLDGQDVVLGDAEIEVTGRDGTVYRAPDLIAHYMDAHSYRPPQAFLDALLADADRAG